MKQDINEPPGMRSKDRSRLMKEGVTPDEIESLFAMMDSIKMADVEAEDYELRTSAQTGEFSFGENVLIGLRGYPISQDETQFIKQYVNELSEMKSKDLSRLIREGVTSAETDSLFAMMDSLKVAVKGLSKSDLIKHLLGCKQFRQRVISYAVKAFRSRISVETRSYPDLRTRAKDLPKFNFIGRLLGYKQFRQRVISYAVKAFRSKIG